MMHCVHPVVIPKPDEEWRRLASSSGIRKPRQISLYRHHPYLLAKFVSKSKYDTLEDRDGPFAHYVVSPFLSLILESHASEFIAQIACLIWFETDLTLFSIISNVQSLNLLSPNSFPKEEFLSWNRRVFSSINISKNVIFLALLFIYRLKEKNPMIRGKSGSEYRLLTIALILGNKFLDDNTYTNKTWAEITGISVKEIHVMEAEFLVNIHYSLLVSKTQWEDWQVILERLWTYSVSLVKIRFLRSLPCLLAPSDIALSYTNNLYFSQFMPVVSALSVPLVPSRGYLKEYPVELKHKDCVLGTSAISLVKWTSLSRINMPCCKS
ncbi:hypothetical protein T552_02677 [Pneumocystis carinii B80]|uniref:Cyclin N-terminal domain-containing protein n=1 Tax=Pneumocystis carinii (strain B80) TaxID=1408658 RepID=A0A0W4ZE68_PNEC8|nr:hypothetical protein T552_02677 [Pneumocystis carinii B80]KTW26668.1 hypothetical protein T552_02677 [Pneumocystis carinii B80]